MQPTPGPPPTTRPRRGGAAAAGFNPLAKLFAGCPDNAFQKVPPGYAPFSLGQRVGAVVRNGAPAWGWGPAEARPGWVPAGGLRVERRECDASCRGPRSRSACRHLLSCIPPRIHAVLCPRGAGTKLFGVGFCASLLGVGITNALMAARQFLDPSFVPLNPPQVRAAAGPALPGPPGPADGA